MERNASFEGNELNGIEINLAWAQVEIFGDDVEKIQVMAAGDEGNVKELRIEVRDGTLVLEQPQYGISLSLLESRWLQVCVRVPHAWAKDVRCTTISGLLSARKLMGDNIALETVSGDLLAQKLTAKALQMKTITGDMRGEELSAERLNVRSVSGDLALDGLGVKQLKANSVNGEQTYNLVGTFEKMDVTAVSGNVIITAPVETMNASLRSISGRVRTQGVTLTQDEDAPTVRVTGVSAELKLIGIKE